MFLNQTHLPLHFHQQPQFPFCHKHNEPVKGLCFFNGKCEDRLMCRLCRKFHDNTHLNYYEELEDLFRKDSVVRDLKMSLENTLNVIQAQNSTYGNNSDYIISQINYVYKEIETNILQKLVQTREMLKENTSKKLEKNNSLRQELLTTLESMTRTYDQAVITRFNPPSTAEDMVQAICKAQVLKDRIEGDLELQSQETISYSLTRLATTVSGNLFQQIKLSLDQIYQDISASFSLDSITKLPSVGKGKLIPTNPGMMQENIIPGSEARGFRIEKTKSPFNKVILEERGGFRPERSKSPFNKVILEERGFPGQAGEKSTHSDILQIFQSVDQEENKRSTKKKDASSTTVAMALENRDAARASRLLMDFLEKNEEPNPRQGGIKKKRLLEYQNETVTNHKRIMFGGMTYVAAKDEIVTAGTDGRIQILSAKNLESKYTFSAHKDEITRLLYVPDKGLLLSAGIDGKINVWDYQHRCKLLHSFTRHNGVVYALEYLPEADLVASGGEDEYIRMWNINTCKESQAMKTTDSKIGSICRLGNTRRIAVGFDKGVVNIISVGQIKKLAYSIRAHDAYVFNLAYIEDQKLLISGAEGGFVKIWRLLETKGECVRRLAHDSAIVRSFVVFPAHDLIISNSNDSHIRIWKTSTGQKLDDYYDKTFGESIVAIYNNDEIVTANQNQVKQWAINF